MGKDEAALEERQAEKKKILDRLGRAIGHLEAVRRMVEQDRDCGEVLTQVAAVRTAVNNVGRMMLLGHIERCVAQAVETGDQRALDELETTVTRFVK